MSASARLRPRLHFTARQGWTNDPHGIVHVDGKYHLFFQYNPEGVHWSPRCHWGHAVSKDLMTWAETDIALSPQGDEVGCWSGSVVIDDRGPVIVYTRIVSSDWAQGQVALARPRSGMSDWVRDPARSVIAGPPEDLDVSAFRDPQVRREDRMWKAIIGAGLAGFGGCALQYSSEDLEHWTFDSVFARQPVEGWSAHTGAVWECPQLLQIGDDWVMIMSAWDGGVPGGVNYAIGHYDGDATFTARRYGSFTHGAELYATTTFRDAEGRPCAMSWLRERNTIAPEGSPWCSAMSMPHVLSIVNGTLAVSQHPNLEPVLAATTRLGDAARGKVLDAAVPGHVWRLRFGVGGYESGGFVLDVTGDGQSFVVNATGESLTVADGSGAVVPVMPVSPAKEADLDMVVDADILEIAVTGTEGIAATRIPVVSTGEIRISPRGRSSITGIRLSRP